jgi:hypothetical protein
MHRVPPLTLKSLAAQQMRYALGAFPQAHAKYVYLRGCGQKGDSDYVTVVLTYYVLVLVLECPYYFVCLLRAFCG